MLGQDLDIADVPPNGLRLSCGRRTRWRKAAERQTKRLASEATIPPYLRAPDSFKRMLGSTLVLVQPTLCFFTHDPVDIRAVGPGPIVLHVSVGEVVTSIP